MSQQVTQNTVQEQTQKLIDGPLKHIRAAALAAALLPLASFAATPASATDFCGSGGVCGTVFNDTNGNGIQDTGEPGIGAVTVLVCPVSDPTGCFETWTDQNGNYSAPLPPGSSYTVSILIPTGTQASPPNVGSNDSIDSDGVPNGAGYTVATGAADAFGNFTPADFGFVTTKVQSPGTGTPGYWKNHPEAWPVSSITVGGVTYTKAQAIAWLGKVGKDKTTTMFSSLVPAMLNRLIGNDTSCVNATIAAANAWMATYGPVGSGVAGGSAAWAAGEPLHQTLDAYNNGLLCAPHRQ